MPSRFDALRAFHGAIAMLVSVLASRDAGATQILLSCCPPGGNQNPCCVGQWEGPYEPPISCSALVPPDCGSCEGDEIAHAALIPPGVWPVPDEGGPPHQENLVQLKSIAGMVLVWTRCDNRPGYTTAVWDPASPDTVAFRPPIANKINDAAPSLEDGPFCAGHTWILDDQDEPKLLVVGGQDRLPHEDQDLLTPGVQGTCAGVGPPICGLHRAYWFDPSASNSLEAWSDEPADPADSRWYPSIVSYLEPGAGFVPLVVGGSALRNDGCGIETGVAHQYPNWWSWSRPIQTSTWSSHSSPYLWHYFPRTLLLSNNTILTVGHDITCEDVDDGPPPLDNPYGGNPVSILDPLTHTRVAGPNPNPDDTDLATATVGAWNYCNAVILHTLKTFTYTEVNPVANYDLDRVVVTGGTRDDENDLGIDDPQPFTHEYAQGSWRVKSSPGTPRIYSNLTILPDGTLFLEGGVDRASEINPNRYYASTARFDPQGPLDSGSWITMSPRPSAGFPLAEVGPDGDAIARGYHHVALLLQDGRVAVLGGAKPDVPPWDEQDPSSRIEVYKPPYVFQGSRLILTQTQAGDMEYGTPYYFTVNDPSRVAYAVLIGIGSVTHHFDFGQRYIELMTTQASGAGNVKALAPPLETMAPEGTYLLFAVELRHGGVAIPSKGVFVKLVL